MSSSPPGGGWIDVGQVSPSGQLGLPLGGGVGTGSMGSCARATADVSPRSRAQRRTALDARVR